MRRLRPGQPVIVTLDDDTDDRHLGCVVADVFGSVASLTHAEDLDRPLRERLSFGAPSYLVFTDRGAEIGLYGIAAATPSKDSVLDFVLLDAVQVSERRENRRVQLVTRARLFPIDADRAGTQPEPIDTFTLNLSASGALLRQRPQFAQHRRYRVELFFAADPQPICCEAVQARETADGIGVEFEHLQETDQARLSERIAAHRNALLQRMSSSVKPVPGKTPPSLDSGSPRRRGPVPRPADRRLRGIRDVSELEGVLGDFGVKFRRLFEAAPNAMAVMTLDGKWIDVNPAHCALLGYSHGELLERGVANVTHPEDVPCDAVLLRSMVAGEIPRYTVDKRHLRKDAHMIWTRVSATLIRDQAGAPQVVITQTEHATKHKPVDRQPRRPAAAT
jgi:PAS domain S-box-containing protein